MRGGRMNLVYISHSTQDKIIPNDQQLIISCACSFPLILHDTLVYFNKTEGWLQGYLYPAKSARKAHMLRRDLTSTGAHKFQASSSDILIACNFCNQIFDPFPQLLDFCIRQETGIFIHVLVGIYLKPLSSICLLVYWHQVPLRNKSAFWSCEWSHLLISGDLPKDPNDSMWYFGSTLQFASQDRIPSRAQIDARLPQSPGVFV